MKRKGHLTKENREVIEAGLSEGDSAGRIAKRIGVCTSTVTREVKANRTIRERKPRSGFRPAARCARYRDCEKVGKACPRCSTKLTPCKRCKTRSCTDKCPDFELLMCPATLGWPYVCPRGCRKRGQCSYPKCSYSASDADRAYRSRLSSSREGIAISEEELSEMDDLVRSLVRNGHSFASIAAAHAGDLPVCERTLYRYQSEGILSTANIDLPRVVRIRPRKRAGKPGRERVDRCGRTYGDFQDLPLELRALTVQCDSVCGYEGNAHDILSMHVVARKFQIYLHKRHADAKAVVTWLDVVERACGAREAFEALFPVLLCDRGVEFDDWEGMERSCLDAGERRCRVFYCDPMDSNQKSQAERNHGQLRRILPKGRTDMDVLSASDVAECCCHVNSYPLAALGGRCAFDLVEGFLPQGLLDELGLEKLKGDEVVLKPSLMPHAVRQ